MRTIFHVSSPSPDDQDHAVANVSNLLDDESVSASGDDVAVVANGSGVRLFVAATTASRQGIADLQDCGVELLACRNSLHKTGATDDDLLPGVTGVPSGVGALARLQDEGYGYVKAP